jgi:glucose uptake protein GlcU
MSNSYQVLKAIEYAVGASMVASIGVLLVGACVFGFHFTQWAEWEGRLVGVVAMIGGIAGAVVGLRMAFRPKRREESTN